MRNKQVVRIQLAVLSVLTILVVGRVFIGPGEPQGVVVMTGFDWGELRSSSFHLPNQESFLLEATGSLEHKIDESNQSPALAAYPWIINRATREIVWKLDPANAEVTSATAVHVATTLTLEPGHYDVFFATFGSSRYSRRSGNMFKSLLGRHWTSDKDKWHITLRPAGDGESSAIPVSVDDGKALGPSGSDVVWTSAPMSGYSKEHFVFTVDSPVSLRAYSIGELCDREECDIGWIEEVFSGRRVWELKEMNSRHAGGFEANRICDANLTLAPGIYRAIFKTDARHAWDDWIANPPFDPAGWGLTLYGTGGSGGVSPFDPWTGLEQLFSINRVGNSARKQVQFEVLEPTGVVLHATGEITGSGSLYDYAWLRSDQSHEQVWEMSWAQSFSAGGAKKNRQEVAFVQLDPGSYSVFYETDDSHAFDSWNSSRPTHPERWGVTAFAFNNSQAIKLSGALPTGPPIVSKAPPVPRADLPPLGTGKTIVDAREQGNESSVAQAITLQAPSRLRISATGEISMSGRYDYAWIESADGTTVWEMTYDNTVAAGGDDANRSYDGIIELPAGSYVIRFASDFSHAYGDFGSDGPAEPSSWGVRAELLPR